MKLSCIATAAFLFATSINVQAHDFWLEPTAYRSQEPNSLALQFKVGHKAVSYTHLTLPTILLV